MTAREPRRILVIDDSPDIHRDFAKILAPAPNDAGLDDLESRIFGTRPGEAREPRFVLDAAHQGEEGFAMVRAANERAEPYLCAFVDMRMPPGWDGLKTIEAIRAIDTETTLIVCTAYSDHSWSQIALRAGVPDRLLVLKKPFDPIEVTQMVHAIEERARLQRLASLHAEELKALVDLRTAELEALREGDRARADDLETIVRQRTRDLQHVALHDRLTGLPNRSHFYDRLLHAINRRHRDPDLLYAVLFIDFDRFKSVNDSMGHHAGDRLLRAIADRLASAIRQCDAVARPADEASSTAARLGGDEFCVLVERLASDDDALRIAQRILDVLSQPYEIGGRDVSLTASIGVTLGSRGYSNAEDALRDADAAMYRAKALGKAQCALYDQSMHADALRRAGLENDIRHAAGRGELRLAYQPVYSLASGEPVAAEALLRWHHPTLGLIPPNDFIAIAEESGSIIPLGDWVLAEVVAQLAAWHRADPACPLRHTAVNVTTKQITDPHFPTRLRETLARCRLDPRLLSLEVTEHALTEDGPGVASAIQAIRDLGVRVTLDDFGMGPGSLAALHKVALDGIKLDRSLLEASASTRRTAAFVQAVLTLARALDMEVIAEGVESLNQVALLQALGCELAQGYLFAQPAPAQEFLASLSTGSRRAA